MASTLTDADLQELLDSNGFFVGSNYAVHSGFNSSTDEYVYTGPKKPAIDELTRVIPFERYDGDPFTGLTPVGPVAAAAESPRFLPSGTLSTAETGATWFRQDQATATPIASIPDSEFTVGAANADYETFKFRYVGASFSLPRFRLAQLAVGSRERGGPDGLMTLKQMARAAVLRQLGRDLINSTAPANVNPLNVSAHAPLRGLAGYYDGGFATSGSVDEQLLQSSNSATSFHRDVRELMRRVTPGHDGFGVGPNALVMSRRARDLLIARSMDPMNASPLAISFLPDPLLPGELRAHYLGVPIYLAPVREDETDDAGTPPKPTFPTDPESFDTTSMWAMRLGGPSGVRVLYVGGDDNDFGLTFEDVTVPGSNNYVVFSVRGEFALYVPDHRAVARLWGVGIADEPGWPVPGT